MNESYKEKTISNIKEKLYQNIYTSVSKLEATAYITSEPVPFEDREIGVKKKIRIKEQWGNLWDCAWFNFVGEVPQRIDYEELIVCLDVSGEGLIVNEHGEPIQGLTTTLSTFDTSLGRPGKKYVELNKIGNFKEEINFWVDCGCNDLFGNYVDSGRLKKAEIVVRNKKIHKLYFDITYLQNLCKYMKEESYRQRIQHALYKGAVLLQDSGLVENQIDKVIEMLKPFLSVIDRYEEDFKLYAIGHAHIDLAWLWPIRETKRKAARTFSTALQMLQKYPDYIFGASQPQMFQWIKEGYPALYDRVKEAVKAGRFECQGGMWVEADTNISGGEALIRQILYGKQFFMEEFEKDMKMVWLPDVFGYTAALPQIMKHTDIDYFMTIKLSWSEHNTFPHHTFKWKGIDGTEVLAHMPPEGTYNSAAIPESFYKAVDNYKEKEVSDKALLLFGIGDGGGGPGETHLESLSRARTSVAVPIVQQNPALQFFKDLEKEKEVYPVWQGELYLEKHQGTYTTHAKNKKYNRKMELALRECEFACTLASEYTAFKYPQETIKEIWKEVLLYQFHDILPGSSIARVYNESLERYELLYKQTLALTQEAYEVLAQHIQVGTARKPVIYFNSLPWEREEVVEYNGKCKRISIPPMGWASYDLTECVDLQLSNLSVMQSDSTWRLENTAVSITFGEDGSITSYFDKQEQRELVPAGKKFNQYVLYKDDGDCWDIPFGYRNHQFEMPKLIATEVYDGVIEKGIVQKYIMGQSSMKVIIALKENQKVLTFAMEVDWHENEKMLRVKCPLDLSVEQAVCEIQFGNIKRPTHKNTSWDEARIEVPAHKWVDLSENGYGVALLNDCKYGYNLWGNTIDLNILRSPKYPSEEEKGLHTLRYAILPHEGSLAESDVVKEAYFFNVPLQKVELKGGECQSMLAQTLAQVQLEKENIIIESMKKAEDGNGYILRLYESKGVKTLSKGIIQNATLVYETNGLEENKEVIELSEGYMTLSFSAFEIKTLRVL